MLNFGVKLTVLEQQRDSQSCVFRKILFFLACEIGKHL